MEQTPPQTTAESFEHLPLAKTALGGAQTAQYRVYTDDKHYKRVEADSALHALEVSGVHKAFKIERESLAKASLLAAPGGVQEDEIPAAPASESEMPSA